MFIAIWYTVSFGMTLPEESVHDGMQHNYYESKAMSFAQVGQYLMNII